MLLPYRAKNPPEVFPYATVGLILLNTLIFAMTSHYFLFVREDVVARFAVSHSNLSPLTVLTAMFLHGSLLHLAGNMLFLWIFGAAAEGRLRPLRFLAVYLFAGFIGSLLSDCVMGVLDPDLPNLGASGAIMGLAGAYLYLFPYAPIRLIWFLWVWLLPRGGVTEWQARWVVLYFLGFDIFNAMLFGGADGVGHFAHLGGAAAGFLAVWALRMPRDNEDVSEVQAVLSDMKDVSLLPLYQLESLMQRPTTDVKLVMAYCRQSLIAPIGASETKCLWGLRQYGNLLMEQAEPNQLLGLVLPLTKDTARQIPPAFDLRLGTRLERLGNPEGAVRLYQRMIEVYPPGPDLETVMLRMGRVLEQVYGDANQARYWYTQMQKQYPQGALRAEAEAGLRRLSGAALPRPAPARPLPARPVPAGPEVRPAPKPPEPEDRPEPEDKSLERVRAIPRFESLDLS